MQVHGAFYLAGILSALANPPPPHSTTAILLISIAATGAACRATLLPALASLVQTRRHAALYDPGLRWWGGASEAGSVVILPALKALRVDRLDAVIISHADADHASGVHTVMEAMPVARVLVSESSRSDRLPHAALCRAADGWTWDGVSFRILHPFPRDRGSRNDRSCVLAIGGSGGGALLPGDVESGGESLLVDRYGAALARRGVNRAAPWQHQLVDGGIRRRRPAVVRGRFRWLPQPLWLSSRPGRRTLSQPRCAGAEYRAAGRRQPGDPASRDPSEHES